MRPTKSLKRTNGVYRILKVDLSACIFFIISVCIFVKKIQARDVRMLIINKLSGDLYLFCTRRKKGTSKKRYKLKVDWVRIKQEGKKKRLETDQR